jgi:predicted nucleic acid-binding protein
LAVAAVLLDTGPLVAYCHAPERHHPWAQAQMAHLRPPLLSCEPVITKAIHLLANYGERPDRIWDFFRHGIIKLAFELEADFETVGAVMRRYADVPMDLADACLVRMSELHKDCRVLTLDRDFRFYRRFGRQVIPLICPD